MQLAALGTLIGTKIAAAGAAIGAASAAHPVLMGLGALTSVAGAGMKVASGIQGMRLAGDQAAFNESARRVANSQAALQMEAERAQAASEAEVRSKNLLRALASQNAVFGSAGIDIGSGTPLDITDQTINQINRQQSQADAFSNARLGMMEANRINQDFGYQQASRVALSRGRNQFFGSLFEAGSSLAGFAMNRSLIGNVPARQEAIDWTGIA